MVVAWTDMVLLATHLLPDCEASCRWPAREHAHGGGGGGGGIGAWFVERWFTFPRDVPFCSLRMQGGAGRSRPRFAPSANTNTNTKKLLR